jgi:hypothetical protein
MITKKPLEYLDSKPTTLTLAENSNKLDKSIAENLGFGQRDYPTSAEILEAYRIQNSLIIRTPQQIIEKFKKETGKDPLNKSYPIRECNFIIGTLTHGGITDWETPTPLQPDLHQRRKDTEVMKQYLAKLEEEERIKNKQRVIRSNKISAIYNPK